MCLFDVAFSYSSDKYQGVKLLGHVVALFLIISGTSTLLSVVAAPVYIPTDSV